MLSPFEDAWHNVTLNCGLVDLARFLPPPTDPLRRVALHEFIKTDLDFRFRQGQPRLLEEYLKEFIPADVAGWNTLDSPLSGLRPISA
jgi:hypothetical protein